MNLPLGLQCLLNRTFSSNGDTPITLTESEVYDILDEISSLRNEVESLNDKIKELREENNLK